jgi:hypothetical protein
MTTQYTTILKLALPVQGELSGTWGDVVNDNITQMVEQAVAGKAVINTWTANSHTLTTADGTTSESRCAILELTDSGTALTGAGTVVCPTNTKLYIVDNNTAEIITVQTAAGTGVAVPVGKTMLVYCDGTNVVEGVTHANSLSLGTSTVTADKILDEDNMASDSATAIATQQSIKAYVDSQVGTVDTLSEILANGNTTGANDIDVDSAQKVQFRDADIYLNSSVDGQLDIVADTEIQIAATTVDLNGNLDVSGTALVTGVLTTTAATVFNGGFASNADSTLGTDKKVQFRDSAIYINSSVDGQLDIVADTEIQIAATTVDLNGDLDVSGTALVAGVLTTTAATVFNGGFASNADSTLGTDKKVQFRDAAIYLNSSVDGQLDIVADGEVQIDTALVDINGNLDVSGTTNISGSVSFTKNAIAGVAISTTSRSSNTVTVTTSAVHGLTSGDLVNVNGVADTSFNGYFTASVSSTTVFTYSQTGADGSSTGGTSTEVVYNLNASGTALNWMNGPLNIAANSGIDGLEITQSGSGEALSITGGNAIFGDNDKAVFGAGSDLQIYHDGSNSYVKDDGAGDLIIQAYDDIKFQQSTDNADLVTINTGGNVTIHGGNLDVTGSVTADGLTVDDTSGTVGLFNSTAVASTLAINNTHANAWGSNIAFRTGGTDAGYFGSIGSLLGNTDQDLSVYSTAGNGFRIYTNGNNERLRVTSAGNVGIGTSTPNSYAGQTALTINSASVARLDLDIGDVFQGYLLAEAGYIGLYAQSGNYISMGVAGVGEALRIDASGTTTFTKSGGGNIRIAETASRYAEIFGYAEGTANGSTMAFHTIESGTSTSTERMRIDASGRLLVGTTATIGTNVVGKVQILFGESYITTNSEVAGFVGLNSNADNSLALMADPDNLRAGSHIAFYVDGLVERMRLDASGNLLVGKTAVDFSVDGVALQPSGVVGITRDGGAPLILNRKTSDGDIAIFQKNGAAVGSIGTNGGRLSIGSGDVNLNFNASANSIYPISDTAGTLSDGVVDIGASAARFKDLHLSGASLAGAGSAASPSISFSGDINTGLYSSAADNIGFATGGTARAFISASQFNMTGNGVFSGSISKGSGSFKIDHPLPEKTETHHLVHSFVESPQADNIYRGKVDLVDGSATVNIDDAAGMTEGTYVLLNTNTQCFTSNESGWTAVKGSVSGNILTITAQESCSDTISWMVVGERHDQHMLDTEWTDENGKVIVEPLKELEGDAP